MTRLNAFPKALDYGLFSIKRCGTRRRPDFDTYGPRMRLDGYGRVKYLVSFNEILRSEPLTILAIGCEPVRLPMWMIWWTEFIVCSCPTNIYRSISGIPPSSSILIFAKTINHLTGNTAGLIYLPDKRMESDILSAAPDVTRARTLLGWEPKVDLEAGIAAND